MKNSPKSPKKRRSQVKNPALIKKYNHRIRQEYLDFDYLDKLSEEELAWLNKFSEEFNNDNYITVEGQLDENGHKILDPTKNLHQTQEHKRSLDSANNARNRCIYGQLKNKGDKFNNTKLLNYENMVGDIETQMSRDINPSNLENAYIEYMDSENMSEMLKEYEEALTSFSQDPE